MSWTIIDQEHGDRRGAFPIRAYSEFMPPPYVGVKPYGERDFSVRGDEHGFVIGEHEEHLELSPGLAKIAAKVSEELRDLAAGKPSRFSKTILAGNPAWTPELAARPQDADLLVLPVALSRTQDDKGRVRWTLFGTSHVSPAQSFWSSFFSAPGVERPDARELFDRFLAFFGAKRESARVDDDGTAKLPAFVRELVARDAEVLISFRPFAELPEDLRRAYLGGALRIIPSPASLIFFGHAGYRRLMRELPRAIQISLLHMFPRSESTYGIRIPQSGWLDERPDAHRVVSSVRRTHRWQRVERDADDALASTLDDRVTVALFSSKPDDLGLYGKPMARNAQIWTEDYRALLDGPNATPEELARAERAMEAGDRFGYRFLFPPMRAGERSLFWHRPLIARGGVLFDGPILGRFTAEREGAEDLHLWPRIAQRPAQTEAARAKKKTATNVRKILEWRELIGEPLPPSFARRLVAAPRDTGFEGWVRSLDRPELAAAVRAAVGEEPKPGPSITLEHTQTRAFEERYWRAIAELAEGGFREKNNADFVLANKGRSGGALGEQVHRSVANERHLELVGTYLHRYYGERIAKYGLEGRAFAADHIFPWETDFDFSWSDAWRKNRASADGVEKNVVLVIPGKNRGEAVIMGDHYDTAYMEDLYAGDRLRAAAAGADDNHSATAALMLAADIFLPLAKAGKLERDVWLVHLTGEEFPCDCLGARALARALLEKNLVLRATDGTAIDVSNTRVAGAFIMDMIAHNHDRDRDIFQIAPGEGRASARLAWHAYVANRRWNDAARKLNRAPERAGRGRSPRMKDGAIVPPIAEHALLTGEVRPEWDPRSSLYNTDAQIFSDVGIPVVLFMENYDISRRGYHDVHDTMENIDLDYGAALAAIAIETAASIACAP